MIMCLVKKFGFVGYGDFQEVLLVDVDDCLCLLCILFVECCEWMGCDDIWVCYFDQVGQSL